MVKMTNSVMYLTVVLKTDQKALNCVLLNG